MLRFLLSLCVGALIPITVKGEIPLQINHQGLVKVNGVPFNGNGDFRFALVDPDTGNNLWTTDGTNIPGPGTPARIKYGVPRFCPPISVTWKAITVKRLSEEIDGTSFEEREM